ncbi:hypothetical protein I2483_13985 [Sporosarcina sp. E16_3]|nr:hypothetical protein [Sporosarcina sp. E16_3]MBO0602774.1 hypothetical protein [Sporosarcina sp. E16_3]
MSSPVYAFLLNMWMMKRLDEAYLKGQVTRGNITQLEMDMILATPQFNL